MSWVFPDGPPYVLLISDAVLDRILDVGMVWSQGLVVALLWQVADPERAVVRVIVSEWRLILEITFAPESLSEGVEGAMLEHCRCVGLVLVQDQSSSPLVV